MLSGKLCAKITDGQTDGKGRRCRLTEEKEGKEVLAGEAMPGKETCSSSAHFIKAFLSGDFHFPVSGPYYFLTDSDPLMVSQGPYKNGGTRPSPTKRIKRTQPRDPRSDPLVQQDMGAGAPCLRNI